MAASVGSVFSWAAGGAGLPLRDVRSALVGLWLLSSSVVCGLSQVDVAPVEDVTGRSPRVYLLSKVAWQGLANLLARFSTSRPS